MAPPLAIVVTPGAANANSYVTLIEADDFFFSHTEFETWDRLDTPTKQRHMIRATRELDQEMLGTLKYDNTLTAGVPNQALNCPRNIDIQGATKFIPSAVKRATCEQISANIQGSSAGWRSDLRAQGVVEVELGDGTREKYADGSGSGGGGGLSALSSAARDELIRGGFISLSTGWCE